MRDGFVNGLMVCRPCWDFKPTYPSPPPDRIAVPIARPENNSVSANNIYYNYLGPNLFSDPWVDPDNDVLWSAGVNSQQHVYAGFYSKKLASVISEITITGLTIGFNYQISVAVWSPATSATVLFNGVDSGLFSSITANKWTFEPVTIAAESETLVITFDAGANTMYFDNIYVQLSESRLLTNSEIIENKSPVNQDDGAVGEAINFFSFAGHDDFNSRGFGSGSTGGILIKDA